MPTKFFCTVRRKIFHGKLWYLLLCIKFFDTPNFLKHWRHAHEIFRHCETKKFRRKIVIPLLCIKFFDTPNFLKHWKDAHEIFLHCETKNFRRKIVIPPIMHKIFRYPNFSETYKGCPRNFSSLKLFETKIFSKTVGFPYESFRQCETWKFRLKIVICPLLSIVLFRYQKISGKQKGSFTKLFVSVLWDKKFRQNRDAPRPSYAWKISMKEFFWNNTKVFSNEMFRYSEIKTSTENLDTPPPPPPYPNFFGTRN